MRILQRHLERRLPIQDVIVIYINYVFAGENPDCQSMLKITTARLFWRGLLYVVAGTVEIKSVHTKQKVAMLEHYKAIL